MNEYHNRRNEISPEIMRICTKERSNQGSKEISYL